MSKAEKAEQRALEAYPVLMCYNDFQMVEEDINKPIREIYQEGYHQAEKDNELTWEDIREIIDISFEKATGLQRKPNIYKEQYYQEVLKCFKDYKERKENGE